MSDYGDDDMNICNSKKMGEYDMLRCVREKGHDGEHNYAVDDIPAAAGNPSGANTEPSSGAEFSPCRKYRYALYRFWGGKWSEYAMFVGLNPSTADETLDDPTIRRCISFAKDWGYGGLYMTNLFAYRATQPEDMKRADDPVGPDNDYWLRKIAGQASVVVAAWGTHGTYGGRHSAVRAMLPNLHCLRLTKDGHPSHPLYLPKKLRPLAWTSVKVEGTERNRTLTEGAWN